MKIAAIDPGETTGWSTWETEGLKKLDGGQVPLWEFVDALDMALDPANPDIGFDNEVTAALRGVEQIVCEDWAIYPREAESGALNWDKCRTARGIGAIELIARRYVVPLKLQPAAIKETAKAMGAEDLFVSPLHENRHENDTAYHAVHFAYREAAKAAGA